MCGLDSVRCDRSRTFVCAIDTSQSTPSHICSPIPLCAAWHATLGEQKHGNKVSKTEVSRTVTRRWRKSTRETPRFEGACAESQSGIHGLAGPVYRISGKGFRPGIAGYHFGNAAVTISQWSKSRSTSMHRGAVHSGDGLIAWMIKPRSRSRLYWTAWGGASCPIRKASGRGFWSTGSTLVQDIESTSGGTARP